MNPFCALDQQFDSITGWCTRNKANALVGAVLALRPQVCCEVGCWSGKSAIPVAVALKSIGTGKIICIDPWIPGASVAGQTEQNAAWWRVQPHEQVYQTFLNLVARMELGAQVDVQRMQSSYYDPPELDLLHLDGNHGPEAVLDVERYAPKIKPGGLLFLDDVTWEGGFVARAGERLLEMGFVKLYEVKGNGDDWALYRRAL